jgi:hypothetical protein
MRLERAKARDRTRQLGKTGVQSNEWQGFGFENDLVKSLNKT